MRMTSNGVYMTTVEEAARMHEAFIAPSEPGKTSSNGIDVRNLQRFARDTLRNLCVKDVGNGRIVFQLTVSENECNQLDGMHGGCIATLIDYCTSMAILTKQSECGNSSSSMLFGSLLKLTHLEIGKAFSYGGVTTDLSVSYTSAAPRGSLLEITCTVEKIGKNLCYTSCRIRNLSADSQLVAFGSHTKVDARYMFLHILLAVLIIFPF